MTPVIVHSLRQKGGWVDQKYSSIRDHCLDVANEKTSHRNFLDFHTNGGTVHSGLISTWTHPSTVSPPPSIVVFLPAFFVF